MSSLRTEPQLDDDFYESLIELHRDLDDAASLKLNAKLVLLLANHIGDREVLRQAFAIARAQQEQP